MFRDEELVVAKLMKKFSLFHRMQCLFRVPVFCAVSDNFTSSAEQLSGYFLYVCLAVYLLS